MVGELLHAKQMTTVCSVPNPRHVSPGVAVRHYLSLSLVLFLVLMDQPDYSVHGNDRTTVELPAWVVDNEVSVRRGRSGEEGMEAHGLGDVFSALVMWLVKTCIALPLPSL